MFFYSFPQIDRHLRLKEFSMQCKSNSLQSSESRSIIDLGSINYLTCEKSILNYYS